MHGSPRDQLEASSIAKIESGTPGPVEEGCEHHHYGYLEDKEAYLRRLRRIEGQVRGLQRMIEDEAYCIDIVTQVSAATRALQSVALGLLDEHLGSCVVQAAREGGPQQQLKLAEASQAIARLVRS